MAASASKRKADYVEAVTRGEGWMPWQGRERVSEAERVFRAEVERRKDEMLGRRMRSPVLITEREIAQARKNIRRADWAKRWFEGKKRIADHIVRQKAGYVDHMLPELTPWTGYTFACPNCIGVKSQEGAEYTLIGWDHRRPDEIRCTCCGQVYPSARYPETASLVCPRAGQTFTFYENDEERKHPEDRSGKYAYHWAHHPIRVSFSGIIRERKIDFMIDGVRTLALVHRLTEGARYAEAVVRILARLARCYRVWLYHDYWDTVADCDALYAAWHDRALPLEWKRNPFTSAYEKDAPDRAAMLQTFWGAGRIRPVFGWLNTLPGICEAYDLTCDARDGAGRPLWTPALRRTVERDLILEWIIDAEPFVGGRGRTENVSNKAPYIYHAQGAVAKCLGIPEFADTALRGYQAIRDRSFGYDGFCLESPSYNAMYLNQLIMLPEMLHGFRWPKHYAGQTGKVNLYRTDRRLRLMLRAEVDQLRPDGRYLPLSDTHQTSGAGGSPVLEVGLRRFPEFIAEKATAIFSRRKRTPTEYALMGLDAGATAKGGALDLPEIYFPNWMTAILRHGSDEKGTVLSLAFNPAGGHRHYDNLSLFYADRGQTILGDQGYLAEAPIQRWVKSTFSHNLVVVDDQMQLFRTGQERRPALRMMVTSPKISVVEASSKAYAQCRDYRRLTALIKGPGAETFAVDIFRVKGGKRHDYRVFSELAASDSKGGRLTFEGLRMPKEKPMPHFGASEREEDIFGLRDIRSDRRPPASWAAVWNEKGRSTRLRMLSQVDAALASHGPGREVWETMAQVGRRVRYVDAIREGEDLESTFVAVHEPSGPRGVMPIREAVRLEVPKQAGRDAVAFRIDSKWGRYLILSEFSREAEVAGVRFKGKLGVVCETPDGKVWWMTCGAETFGARGSWLVARKKTGHGSRVTGHSGRKGGEGFGFEDAPAVWKGKVVSQTDQEMVTDTDRPEGWGDLPEGISNYVLVQAEPHLTGFPVKLAGKRRIAVDRFPLPKVRRFELLAVRFGEASPL
ncbi:MAG: hypothetical protein EXS64_14880 [Candidatus Latescibacteria bacterium]|nr:hypothetical protein [Candidatus Latescibacterota bacterium]